MTNEKKTTRGRLVMSAEAWAVVDAYGGDDWSEAIESMLIYDRATEDDGDDEPAPATVGDTEPPKSEPEPEPPDHAYPWPSS